MVSSDELIETFLAAKDVPMDAGGWVSSTVALATVIKTYSPTEQEWQVWNHDYFSDFFKDSLPSHFPMNIYSLMRDIAELGSTHLPKTAFYRNKCCLEPACLLGVAIVQDKIKYKQKLLHEAYRVIVRESRNSTKNVCKFNKEYFKIHKFLFDKCIEEERKKIYRDTKKLFTLEGDNSSLVSTNSFENHFRNPLFDIDSETRNQLLKIGYNLNRAESISANWIILKINGIELNIEFSLNATRGFQFLQIARALIREPDEPRAASLGANILNYLYSSKNM